MSKPAFQLQLMIGPGIPVPVPRAVLDALVSVEVQSKTAGPSEFQLSFSIPPRSPLQTLFLLGGGVPIPMVRVVILVIVNGIPEVLMDGVMMNHELQPGDSGGASTLTITGQDLSRAMDYLRFDGVPFPAQPPNVRVMAVLAKYMALGVIPMVIPTIPVDFPNPLERVPHQSGTDLEYVTTLAREVGYDFWVEPGPLPLQSIAYWGPPFRVGPIQPALNTDMDAETNVDSMTFGIDNEQPRLPIVMIYPMSLKIGIPIPIPNINPLDPPLGLVPPLPKSTDIDRESARTSPAAAILRGFARAAQTSNAVTVNGTLDVARYGRVLRSRKLVGVRGAGMAFDGLYYVREVKHNIKRGEYKQTFSLARNGLISTTPRVPA